MHWKALDNKNLHTFYQKCYIWNKEQVVTVMFHSIMGVGGVKVDKNLELQLSIMVSWHLPVTPPPCFTSSYIK